MHEIVTYEDYLEHYGVKGMRWRYRKPEKKEVKSQHEMSKTADPSTSVGSRIVGPFYNSRGMYYESQTYKMKKNIEKSGLENSSKGPGKKTPAQAASIGKRSVENLTNKLKSTKLSEVTQGSSTATKRTGERKAAKNGRTSYIRPGYKTKTDRGQPLSELRKKSAKKEGRNFSGGGSKVTKRKT